MPEAAVPASEPRCSNAPGPVVPMPTLPVAPAINNDGVENVVPFTAVDGVIVKALLACTPAASCQLYRALFWNILISLVEPVSSIAPRSILWAAPLLWTLMTIPATSRATPGPVVPIPTLPFSCTLNNSLADATRNKAPVEPDRLPTISATALGLVVPMPTLPVLSITILLFPAASPPV